MIFRAALRAGLLLGLLMAVSGTLHAADPDNDKQQKLQDTSCGHLPGYAELKAAIDKATAEETSGLNNQMLIG